MLRVLLTTVLLANDEISLTGSILILNLDRNLILLHLYLSNLLLLCRSISTYTRVKFSIFWISKLRNLIGNVIRSHICVIEHFWWILRTWLSCSSSMAWYLLLNLKLLILQFTLVNLNFIRYFVLRSGHWMFLSNFLTTAQYYFLFCLHWPGRELDWSILVVVILSNFWLSFHLYQIKLLVLLAWWLIRMLNLDA